MTMKDLSTQTASTQMEENSVLKTISADRNRTNLLKKWEQNAIAYLVQRIPSWISSDMLTAIGFAGAVIIFLSFVLATYVNRNLLLLGVLGYAISWFGDSLDGRIAYYRHKERKWYGFSLDITVDWLGIMMMGLGFVVYVHDAWELVGFALVALYGWEMMTALLRYKITGKYSIDSGVMGPTEVRIIISLLLILEVVLPNSLLYSLSLLAISLFIANIVDTKNLLVLANDRDAEEREKRKEKQIV